MAHDVKNSFQYKYFSKSNNRFLKNISTMIDRVADLDVPVLICGETGTGKEVVADLIHESSLRRNGNLVKCNCSAITDSLFESEMFGHKAGAFTGSKNDKIGLFEMADKGTLFLDELDSMPINHQGKMLRAIEGNSFMRVGDTVPLIPDVRIIATFSKFPISLVKSGKLRPDLYYRINTIIIDIPPVRHRHQEDVIRLANYFLTKAVVKFNLNTKLRFTEKSIKAILEHSWLGNVRELDHTIIRHAILETTDLITISFDSKYEIHVDVDMGVDDSICYNLDRLEETAIHRALSDSRYKQSEAAKLLGITPRSLNYKIAERNITHPSWKVNSI